MNQVKLLTKEALKIEPIVVENRDVIPKIKNKQKAKSSQKKKKVEKGAEKEQKVPKQDHVREDNKSMSNHEVPESLKEHADSDQELVRDSGEDIAVFNDEAEVIEEFLEAFSKSADNVNDFLHEREVVSDDYDNTEAESRAESSGISDDYEHLEQEIVSIHTCLVLAVLVMVLLLAVIALIKCRHHQDYDLQTKSDKFHKIGGICSPPPEDRSLYNQNFRNTFDSPKVSTVQEAVNSKTNPEGEEWSNRNWNQEFYKEPYKRK